MQIRSAKKRKALQEDGWRSDEWDFIFIFLGIWVLFFWSFLGVGEKDTHTHTHARTQQDHTNLKSSTRGSRNGLFLLMILVNQVCSCLPKQQSLGSSSFSCLVPSSFSSSHHHHHHCWMVACVLPRDNSCSWNWISSSPTQKKERKKERKKDPRNYSQTKKQQQQQQQKNRNVIFTKN